MRLCYVFTVANVLALFLASVVVLVNLKSQSCHLGAWARCSKILKVDVIVAGGTIGTNGTNPVIPTNYTDYGSIAPKDFVKGIPGASEGVEFRFIPLFNKGSPDLTTGDNLAISHYVFTHRYESHAFLIMGGTDTAHNTINQHSDTLRLPLCVGYVASARPNSALSADGPMNFAQNLQVIRDPSSWGYGAFMAFNERIWGPFLLYKRTTNGLDMFDSAAGPLGIMKGGKPHFWYGPREHRGRLHFDIKKLAPIKPPRVVITYATEPETVVTLLHDPEVAGVVIIGQGAGSMPTAGTDMISAASAENKHKPIVVCLMIPDGVVGYPMYGAGDWAIPGGYMEALRCRYVVQLALMSGMDVQQIRHLFEVDAISLKSDPFYTVRLYWFIFERVVMMTIQDCKDRLKGANEMLDLLVEDVTRPIGKRISEWLALFIGNVQRHRGIIRLA